MKEAFIKRTYHISKAQDVLIKRLAKKNKSSESGVVRASIDRINAVINKKFD